MSAAALEAALQAAGIQGRVTADGPLALLRLAPGDRTLEDPARRRTAVAIAIEHGFRNLALEVDD